MNNKNLLSTKIVFLVGLVLCLVVNILACVAKKPVITEQSFPFTITYEFQGEVRTIEDEFVCSYDGRTAYSNPYDRYYSGYLANANEGRIGGDYLIESYDNGELVIITRFFAGYMMDKQYKDHYNEYYRFEPYVAFFDYESYMELSEPEELEPYGVRIIDWEYPEPVENSYVFGGLARFGRYNVIPMLGCALLTLLACIIFVKRDRSITYKPFDKLGLALNIIMSVTVLPFLTVVCSFMDINGSGTDPMALACFCVPAIAVYGLALSVCLRRRGYTMPGFAVQFAGVIAMALLLAVDAILHLSWF